MALGLTILSYAYEGLTPQALLNLLIGLRELADPASAALWAQWTAHCRWRNAPQLDALVLRADSADLLTAHRHLGRDFGVVCAYLERHVFANLGDAEFKVRCQVYPDKVRSPHLAFILRNRSARSASAHFPDRDRLFRHN